MLARMLIKKAHYYSIDNIIIIIIEYFFILSLTTTCDHMRCKVIYIKCSVRLMFFRISQAIIN